MIDVHARLKAAGIAQREAVGLALGLRRALAGEHHERAGLHAGRAARGACPLVARNERAGIRAALARPRAAERGEIVVAALKVHTGAERSVHDDIGAAAVDDARAAGDHVRVGIDGVAQLDRHAADGVAQRQQKGLRALAAGAGQIAQRWLAGDDLVGHILEQQC